MEEYLAKAELDNLLNSEKQKQVDHYQKLNRLRYIYRLVGHLNDEFCKYERYFVEPTKEVDLEYYEMLPILEVLRNYNEGVPTIMNLSPTNLRIRVRTYIQAIIRTTNGIYLEKFLLMENLAEI